MFVWSVFAQSPPKHNTEQFQFIVAIWMCFVVAYLSSSDACSLVILLVIYFGDIIKPQIGSPYKANAKVLPVVGCVVKNTVQQSYTTTLMGQG